MILRCGPFTIRLRQWSIPHPATTSARRISVAARLLWMRRTSFVRLPRLVCIFDSRCPSMTTKQSLAETGFDRELHVARVFPSLQSPQGGWLHHQEDVVKPPKLDADGVVFLASPSENHPVSVSYLWTISSGTTSSPESEEAFSITSDGSGSSCAKPMLRVAALLSTLVWAFP